MWSLEDFNSHCLDKQPNEALHRTPLRSAGELDRAPGMARYLVGESPMARFTQSRRQGEGQGRRREAGSEGSLEQNRDPMNKNRIRGSHGRTSGHVIAKSLSIKAHGCKFGGRAGKADVLTSGGPRHVPESRLRRQQCRLIVARKSAEAIVGASRRAKRQGAASRPYVSWRFAAEYR